MKSTTSADFPTGTPATTGVAETVAAVALGLFATALLSGRVVFAIVVAVGVLAILFSPTFLRTSPRLREAAKAPLVVAAAAVLIAWIPSTVASILPWTSVQVYVRMVLFLGLGVLVYAYFADRPGAVDLLLRTLMVGLAIGLVVAILAIVGSPALTVLLVARVADTAEHAILTFKAAGSAAMVLAPLVLWAGWRLGGRWRIAAVSLSVALLLLTALTGSRAGLAGLIGALGITMVALALRPETRRWSLRLLLLFAVVVVGVGIFLLDRKIGEVLPQRLVPFPEWLIDPHRQVIWSFAIKLAAEHPWIGWGINTINLIPEAVAAPKFHKLPMMPSHPHNWILEVFAETGAVGVIPMITMVVALFVSRLRAYRRTADVREIVILAASAAFWVSGLFNFSFWSAWWQVAYILVLAILSAGRARAR